MYLNPFQEYGFRGFLRLLGRGKVQTRAIQELFALPEVHPLRRNLLQIGRRWLTLFHAHRPRTPEDKELFVNLQGTFEEWERDVKEKSLEKGEFIGKILVLREILQQTPASSEGLKDLSLEQLESMLKDLRARLRS